MIQTDRTKLVVLLIAGVVAASGCLQTETANLDSNFDTSHEDIDLNQSANSIYEESLDAIENTSSYSLNADNRMVMNLKVFGVEVNMSSKGEFEQQRSRVNSSGAMSFKFGGNSNSTEFQSTLISDENSTRIGTGPENDRNWSERDTIPREDLGLSAESLQTVDMENISVLGKSQLDNEEVLLLELGANATDLMKSSSSIFEKLSPIQESTDSQDMEDVGSFGEKEVYLWIERDSMMPRKLAYYGEAGNGALQVRSVTEYSG